MQPPLVDKRETMDQYCNVMVPLINVINRLLIHTEYISYAMMILICTLLFSLLKFSYDGNKNRTFKDKHVQQTLLIIVSYLQVITMVSMFAFQPELQGSNPNTGLPCVQISKRSKFALGTHSELQ